MYRKVAKIYQGELPFLIVPLAILAVSLVIIRFAVVPQFVRVSELRNSIQSQNDLVEEKTELMKRLKAASLAMPLLPNFQKVSINDESTLIQLLLKSANKSGITLTQTVPSRDESSFIVQTAFSANWDNTNRFLRELEQYPTTIVVMPVAFNRQGVLIDVTLTVRSIPEGGVQ